MNFLSHYISNDFWKEAFTLSSYDKTRDQSGDMHPMAKLTRNNHPLASFRLENWILRIFEFLKTTNLIKLKLHSEFKAFFYDLVIETGLAIDNLMTPDLVVEITYEKAFAIITAFELTSYGIFHFKNFTRHTDRLYDSTFLSKYCEICTQQCWLIVVNAVIEKKNIILCIQCCMILNNKNKIMQNTRDVLTTTGKKNQNTRILEESLIQHWSKNYLILDPNFGKEITLQCDTTGITPYLYSDMFGFKFDFDAFSNKNVLKLSGFMRYIPLRLSKGTKTSISLKIININDDATYFPFSTKLTFYHRFPTFFSHERHTYMLAKHKFNPTFIHKYQFEDEITINPSSTTVISSKPLKTSIPTNNRPGKRERMHEHETMNKKTRLLQSITTRTHNADNLLYVPNVAYNFQDNNHTIYMFIKRGWVFGMLHTEARFLPAFNWQPNTFNKVHNKSNNINLWLTFLIPLRFFHVYVLLETIDYNQDILIKWIIRMIEKKIVFVRYLYQRNGVAVISSGLIRRSDNIVYFCPHMVIGIPSE